jgi:hypothetical protein
MALKHAQRCRYAKSWRSDRHAETTTLTLQTPKPRGPGQVRGRPKKSSLPTSRGRSVSGLGCWCCHPWRPAVSPASDLTTPSTCFFRDREQLCVQIHPAPGTPLCTRWAQLQGLSDGVIQRVMAVRSSPFVGAHVIAYIGSSISRVHALNCSSGDTSDGITQRPVQST